MVGKTYHGLKWYYLRVRGGRFGYEISPIITKAVDMKRIAEFWGPGASNLGEWMKNRYIRNQPLELILTRPTVELLALW